MQTCSAGKTCSTGKNGSSTQFNRTEIHMTEIPDRATQRYEYVKCGNVDCRCFEGAKIHGPYLYAYWKEDGKLKKKYIGKSWDEWVYNELARQSQTRLKDVKKYEYIREQSKKGDKLAIEYEKKLLSGKVSYDWAHKVITNEIKGRRFLRVAGLAEDQGFEIDSNETYIEFLKDLMKNKNLTTIEELDSYLNCLGNS